MAGKFNLDNYVPVQVRIQQFWEQYPNGRIVTDLFKYDENLDRVIFVAYVYKDKAHELADATGWAEETKGGYGANQVSHVENAETSAIGRAIANLGFATSLESRPSREEMQKVERVTGAFKVEKANG